jgi:hypothetical protein
MRTQTVRVRYATLLTAMLLGLTINGSVHAQAVTPDFSAAVFHEPLLIDNPYFPLVPGTTYTYMSRTTEADSGDVTTEMIVVEVLHETRSVAGISSRVVRDRVFVDELLVEDTFDWYAQDNTGNVWYLGEDVTDYEYDDEGNLVGVTHPGAWEAGVDGAKPGYIMKADPQIGDSYYQELLIGVAEDEAEVLALSEMQTVPFGTFSDVLRIRETTALDQTALAHKFYAPGIGTILETELDIDTGDVLATVELVSVVPEPDAICLVGLAAVCPLLLSGRRRLRASAVDARNGKYEIASIGNGRRTPLPSRWRS